MNAKELKIEAPEGYEVDWDNSSNNIIRFKPVKKKITYEDVILNIRATNIGVSVQFGLTKTGEDYFITSEKQLEQLLALNKLMNVAEYLNGDWEPNFKDTNHFKYYISYDFDTKQLKIWFKQYMNDGSVYFRSEELAHQAIEILGEEEVKKALGIFE